jgi:hypothetical protein
MLKKTLFVLLSALILSSTGTACSRSTGTACSRSTGTVCIGFGRDPYLYRC